MTTTDTDLELLEEYLDGNVEGSALMQLRDRLNRHAELSEALNDLQAQRAMRQAVWQAIEPDTAAAQQLVWRVRGAMLHQPKRQSLFSISQWQLARVGSAAAACMVLGFLVGRLGHRGDVSPLVSAPGFVSTDLKSPAGNSIAQNGSPSSSTAGFVPVGTTPKISVPITNEYGQVVAWQTFDNPEQAKNFTEDLHRAHGDSSAPATSGQIKTVGSEQVPF
jgi:anti-sigma factor RsiW